MGGILFEGDETPFEDAMPLFIYLAPSEGLAASKCGFDAELCETDRQFAPFCDFLRCHGEYRWNLEWERESK